MKKQFIIFTDMDGTLLDHHTYSHEPATEMLTKLQLAKIPVIPTTSKTYAELTVLREKIGLESPFIVENGAAIHIPHGFFRQKPSNTLWMDKYWVRQFTSRKQYWLNLLALVGKNFEGKFTHFHAMGPLQIAAATGLSLQEAELAATRQFGEPVLWLGNESEKEEFIQAVSEKGATPLQGGRFIHISGDCDKGTALTWFMQEFQRQYTNQECVSIALGDGENDVAMLEAADFSVIVRSPVNPLPKLSKQHQVIITDACGPAGWSEGLEKILSSYLKEA